MTNKGNLINSGVWLNCVGVLFVCIGLCCGCGGLTGYSDEALFPEDVDSVYVEMFDSQSLRRGTEYKLSDALSKRIEAETPYKVISNRDRADTVMSGRLEGIGSSALSTERQVGRVLESEVRLTAVVSWKNLKTGQLLIDNKSVTASASYSTWQNQTLDYAAALAANKLAQRIVELMEKEW